MILSGQWTDFSGLVGQWGWDSVVALNRIGAAENEIYGWVTAPLWMCCKEN